MTKRLFVSINLPGKIKTATAEILGKLKGAKGLEICRNVKFTPLKNCHITFLFLGDQEEETLEEIKKAVRESAAVFIPPEVKFEKVVLAPPGRKPRMVWLEGDDESSKKLGELANVLGKNLKKFGISYENSRKKFSAHLTLARFDPCQVYGLENLVPGGGIFKADSLDLMESHLKNTGAEYKTLLQAEFKTDE